MLAEKAKKYGTYAVATLLETDGDLFHNTAVLIDRAGDIAGIYRKVHLTMGETDSGLTPGTEFPVFETDFGRVGLLTCWDNWFGESARALRLHGAEILFMPLAGDGSSIHWDTTWKARAIDNGVWFVTSSTVTDSPSRIINPEGEIVADANGGFAYAMADINLNQEWRQQYHSTKSYGEPARFLVKERRPDTYGPVLRAQATETDPSQPSTTTP
jgi:predicted amidohydrolase